MDDKYTVVSKSVMWPQVDSRGVVVEERVYDMCGGPSQYAVTVEAYEKNHKTEIHFISCASNFLKEETKLQVEELKKLRDAVDAAYTRLRNHLESVTLPVFENDES